MINLPIRFSRGSLPVAWPRLDIDPPMQFFRTVIHGQLIEFRHGDFGGETLLINGRPIANRPFGGWWRKPHYFSLKDEANNDRQVELRLVDVSRFGVGKYRMVVSVDGHERARIEPADDKRVPNTCANCGYSLAGLPVENIEVRCPECGRHTSALILTRDAE